MRRALGPLALLAVAPVLSGATTLPLTLLFQNSLDFTKNAKTHPGLILSSTTSTQASAHSVCSSLSESLVSLPAAASATSAQQLLEFQTYINAIDRNELLWVNQVESNSKSNRGKCTAAKASNLALVEVNCNERLPALCTNSAPYSNSTLRDASSRWHVAVESQGRTFTGYRDYASFRFLGIPYANAPERWEYSTVYSGSKRSFQATAPGSICTQGGGTDESEDCLFANVFTPYLPAGSGHKTLKPVMFWIHGGAYTGGEGTDSTFDGGALASRGDVVVVTINYRLSTLGFLALNDGVIKGNYGLADQITALKWVKANIAAFGGDPNHITIFGQSAGAGSVRALLASPKAEGLFQGAIAQSNLAGADYSATYSNYLSIPAEVTLAGNSIVSLTGCTNSNAAAVRACLKKVPATTLVSLAAIARYVVVDGTYITSSELPLNGRTHGVSKVPTIWGWMQGDGAAFIGYPAKGQTVTQFLEAQGLVNASVANAIAKSDLFPQPNTGNTTLDVFNVTQRITTDIMFRCLDQATVEASVVNNVFPVNYVYEFDRSYQTPGFNPNAPVCTPPVHAGFPNGDPSKAYFQCHSGELYYVFGTQGQFGLPYRDAEDLAFGQYALDVWSAFGRTFNPNPSVGWLKARGYTSTLKQLEGESTWEPASRWNSKPLRIFDGKTVDSQPWKDQKQCDLLGYPLNFYL